MGRELRRRGAVVPRVNAAALAFRDVIRQRRVGRGGFPPGRPALGVPAGEPSLILTLAQGQRCSSAPAPATSCQNRVKTAAFRARLS